MTRLYSVFYTGNDGVVDPKFCILANQTLSVFGLSIVWIEAIYCYYETVGCSTHWWNLPLVWTWKARTVGSYYVSTSETTGRRFGGNLAFYCLLLAYASLMTIGSNSVSLFGYTSKKSAIVNQSIWLAVSQSVHQLAPNHSCWTIWSIMLLLIENHYFIQKSFKNWMWQPNGSH